MRGAGRGRPWLLAALLLAAGACEEGQVANSGLTEPLRVSGQFIPGDLPGTPPPPEDAGASVDAGAAGGHLQVTQAFVPPIPVPGGAGGVAFSGQVTNDSAAVGVRFADMGTGYWVVPIGSVEQMSGDYTFKMTVSFNASDPPGPHDVLFVAIDGNGRAGVQNRQTVCLNSLVPDNGHACVPDKAPPTAVFSLAWDADFDLDLHVVTPEGVDINAKTRPSLVFSDSGAPAPATSPRVDRDSLGHCTPDGYRQEDISWPPLVGSGLPNPPSHGTYLVYVDPFAACGQPAVRFTFTLYTLSGQCPDCRLVAKPPVNGELLASQVTGGTGPKTFLTQYSF